MRKIVLLPALLLAGCATTMADVRGGPTEISYETAKPVQATLQCLTEGLASTPNPNTVSAYSSGWSIVWVHGAWFADVLPTPGGTRVNYYQHTFGAPGAGITRAIEACR